MVRLKILAQDRTAGARSKIFEKFLASVLDHFGYRLDRILGMDDAGREIEMAGEHTDTGLPVYAECRYHETAITAPDIQAFYGKYMTRWHTNKQCHGLLIAIPGADDLAKIFYREHILKNAEVRARLYEETEVLKAIIKVTETAPPEIIARRIPRETGNVDDGLLLYTEKGIFWVFFVTPLDQKSPSRAALFDAGGNPVADRPTIRYLTELYSELNNFDTLAVSSFSAIQPGLFQDEDKIIELAGSLEFFDYLRPTSPEHFIGRQTVLDELESFAGSVINKETATRGIVIEAPPGWGKSSLVLAAIARFREKGHFAVALDTRSAASSRYVQRAIDYILHNTLDFSPRIFSATPAKAVFGFEDAVNAVLEIGHSLERQGKLLLVFFDHFETIFPDHDILKRFRELYLKLCDVQTNVILGFSCKTKSLGPPDGFIDEPEEILSDSAKHIGLDIFCADEADSLLERLDEALGKPLKKDFRFMITEFSQGYPWLLKRLCAHVLTLAQAGVSQSDLAEHRIKFEVLFEEQLRTLSTEAEKTLRRIAKAAPIRIQDACQINDSETIQDLIRHGLLTRSGNTYDIYRDDFKDFLADGTLPERQNYILLSKVGDVFNATRILQKTTFPVDAFKLQTLTKLSPKDFYHVIRDMELLGLAKESNGKVILQRRVPLDAKEFETSWRKQLGKKLLSNPAVRKFLKLLQENQTLTLELVSEQLKILLPFISATERNWITYGRKFAKWMDAADLAFLDNHNQVLSFRDPHSEIRERYLILPKRRGTRIPAIQYAPVEGAAIRLVQALQKGGGADWTGFKKSTLFRALATLEDLGFIRRKSQFITVLPKGREFVSHPEMRPRLFAEGALKLKLFADFIEILNVHKHTEKTLLSLGLELREKLGANWKNNTAETIAKIMLDWSRHAKLAPGVFGQVRKGPIKALKKKQDPQIPLF
ncbi:MAG: hypothetical protein KKH68_07840 [Proteobacteria bacterium]|nr:hypothetical protein [Pseudomonadota bacterium]